jgi:hypothetical protein
MRKIFTIICNFEVNDSCFFLRDGQGSFSHLLGLFICIYILLSSVMVFSQSYSAFGNNKIYNLQIDYADCTYECSVFEIGSNSSYHDGVTYCPNGNLYGMDGSAIFQIDPFTGVPTILFPGEPGI